MKKTALSTQICVGSSTQQHVRYGTQSCALGTLLVAATAKGVCSVELANSAQELIQRLHIRLPQAQKYSGDSAFKDWINTVAAFIQCPQGLVDLPLDIQGTVFQRLVWSALRDIPCGQTQSYSEVAIAIGKPKAARAVARACASNSLAVVIPCHRVVRSDGSLSGYRWGIERKAELLRRESTAPQK